MQIYLTLLDYSGWCKESFVEWKVVFGDFTKGVIQLIKNKGWLIVAKSEGCRSES